MSELGPRLARMGEMVISAGPDVVLSSIGLGSCIGLVLLDEGRSLAGLAHIVLPSAGGRDGEELRGRFADLAVPELLARLAAAGARRVRLRAVLVGGAQMLALRPDSSLDVGRRNEQATREALERARIAVVAAATGGSHGRTVRVYPQRGLVTVKGAGSGEQELYCASPALRCAA
jgi:chemotaxis protein CheD